MALELRHESGETRGQLRSAIIAVAFGWIALWSADQGLVAVFDKEQTPNTPTPIAALTPLKAQNEAATLRAFVATATTSVDIAIGGDAMFDRNIRAIAEKIGYDTLLQPIVPIFKDADISAINLEGPITNKPSKTLLSNGKTSKDLTFTFSPKVAPYLADAGIDFVSLANNHTDNFGKTGLDETRQYLKKSGIGYFGDPWNSPVVATTEKNGIKVAFVGYSGFQLGMDKTTAKIRELHDDGYFVVVMPHWGEEYATTSTALQRSKAKSFIEAGAGAIVGSHPHVIQENVWIDGVPVFYSVGNLVFDQYFSADVKKGEIVVLHVAKGTGAVITESATIYGVSMVPKKGVSVDMDAEVSKP